LRPIIARPRQQRSRSLHGRGNNESQRFRLRIVLLLLLGFLIAFQTKAYLRLIPSSFNVNAFDNLVTDSILNGSFTAPSTKTNYDELDASCPFRHSPLYRKIYIYPTYNGSHWIDDGFTLKQLQQIVSDVRKSTLSSDDSNNVTGSFSSAQMPAYPWVYWDNLTKAEETINYHPRGNQAQYNSGILFRSLLTHPRSCLRTFDPDEAALFYVPYMATIDYWRGERWPPSSKTSPHAQALIDVIADNDYSAWEELWGLTSRYWKRRQGADHILVYPEPLHGLWHPRSRRGSFHFINSQYQLRPPIALGVEFSTAFVKKYPKCAAKNILLPYPEPDGRWYSGVLESEARSIMESSLKMADDNDGAEMPAPLQGMLVSEKDPTAFSTSSPRYSVGWGAYSRPVGYYYSGGPHGECTHIRMAINQDYRECSPSSKALFDIDSKKFPDFRHGMHLSTFCICTGGDSPSAKRMFNCVLAGSIPVILSKDFVWPFSNELLPNGMDSRKFSIRLNASDFAERRQKEGTCEVIDDQNPPLGHRLEQVTAEEIRQLRIGMKEAATAYSWFRHVGADDDTVNISYNAYEHRGDISDANSRKTNLPDNPMINEVVPDGGLAHGILKALAERADGSMWRECEEELKVVQQGNDPTRFEC